MTDMAWSLFTIERACAVYVEVYVVVLYLLLFTIDYRLYRYFDGTVVVELVDATTYRTMQRCSILLLLLRVAVPVMTTACHLLVVVVFLSNAVENRK